MKRNVVMKLLALTLTGVTVFSATACAGAIHSVYTEPVIYDVYEEAEEQYETIGDTAPDPVVLDFNTEEYNPLDEQGFFSVKGKPLSTFAADVDTGSYTNLRSCIRSGAYVGDRLPSGMIRYEEMVNYFDYDVREKSNGKFSIDYAISDCPWNQEHKLMVLTTEANPVETMNAGNNFVYLIDVSGSMRNEEKIDMAVKSFAMLSETLTENDRVSIVTYAYNDEIFLEDCKGNDTKTIFKALEKVKDVCYGIGGGTNGSGGIEAAYRCAVNNFIPGGNNRVIIASDGDMNLGVSTQGGLVDLIKEKKESGVFLTTLGFGRGNYSDANMEQIADAGNGNYFYIDCLEEGYRVLVEKMKETTVTVAKDVKYQVEFNPALVSKYKLIGYDNRVMADEDFKDDKKDGGEIGAKSQVTILYELVPAGMEDTENELKYQGERELSDAALSGEVATMHIRYKEVAEDASVEEEYPIEYKEEVTDDFYFAAGLVEACFLLTDSEYKGTSNENQALELMTLGASRDDRVVAVDMMKEAFMKYQVAGTGSDIESLDPFEKEAFISGINDYFD